MITVLRVVSRAYEICIPLHHTESQIFDVTDAKNLGCRFPPYFPSLRQGSGCRRVGGLDDHTKAGDRRGR